jgi:hypothetical protein
VGCGACGERGLWRAGPGAAPAQPPGVEGNLWKRETKWGPGETRGPAGGVPSRGRVSRPGGLFETIGPEVVHGAVPAEEDDLLLRVGAALVSIARPHAPLAVVVRQGVRPSSTTTTGRALPLRRSPKAQGASVVQPERNGPSLTESRTDTLQRTIPGIAKKSVDASLKERGGRAGRPPRRFWQVSGVVLRASSS